MKNKLFQLIDHTADIGIIAYGVDTCQLFVSAAYALFNLIAEPETITERLQIDIKVSAKNSEDLLVAWLNELIYFVDAEHMLFSRFQVTSITDNQLGVICYGEQIDPQKHKLKRDIKAATYHKLRIGRSATGYKAEIIFDI